MASVSFAPESSSRRLTLSKIDSAVSARLGPTRGLGNSQPACFNRQIAMYLAKHLGRWSRTVIGRFYNGRNHSTFCHAIQRIEALRESNPDVDALLSSLKSELAGDDVARETKWTSNPVPTFGLSLSDLEQLADLIADLVCEHLRNTALSRLPSLPLGF